MRLAADPPPEFSEQESPGLAHNEIEGPLVEIGSRSVFDKSAVGLPAVASGGGS